MFYLAKLFYISVAFVGEICGSPAPQQFVGLTLINDGRGTSISSGGGIHGATVVALDPELGGKMQKAIGKHTQGILQQSQENLQRTLANSNNFSRRLQAGIQASVQRSLASAGILPPSIRGIVPPNIPKPVLNLPQGVENLSGIGDSFAKTLQDDIARTIAASQAQSRNLQSNIQQITNEALQKAAKEGKLKVINAPGGGPISLVSSNGQGIILTNSQPGGVVQLIADGSDPNMRIYSNVPIQVNGKGASQVRVSSPRQIRSKAVPAHVNSPVRGANLRDNVIETEQ